ncbi:hypothetical protein K2X33_04945 [bacterium]|nr:hypothetical protein [bacterium]
MKYAIWILMLSLTPSWGATRDSVYLLPLECSELMPDNAPFVGFFEGVGRANLRSDGALTKRVFRLIAIRERLQSAAALAPDQNPIDLLIRKTLCFFREKKEPLKTVSVDDAEFLTFLKESLPDLERKVDQTVLQIETEKQQRKVYEKMLQANQALEASLRAKAELDADRDFERLTKAAKQQARSKE